MCSLMLIVGAMTRSRPAREKDGKYSMGGHILGRARRVESEDKYPSVSGRPQRKEIKNNDGANGRREKRENGTSALRLREVEKNDIATNKTIEEQTHRNFQEKGRFESEHTASEEWAIPERNNAHRRSETENRSIPPAKCREVDDFYDNGKCRHCGKAESPPLTAR